MNCPNCDQQRAGSFCSHCGQNDRDYQRSLPPLMGDLLRETFEMDSRLAHTLNLLLFQPGELALEFSRNRRASYVAPIRLYLFVSITFFFLLSVGTEVTPGTQDRPVVIAQSEEIGDIDSDRMMQVIAEHPVLGAERLRRANEILARPDSSAVRLALLQIAKSVDESDAAELTPVQNYLIGETIDALYEPASIVRQFMDNLAVGMLIMLPVYALLLKLFYSHRKRYYVEMLVFSTHLHTFVYLVFMGDMVVSVRSDIGWLDATLDMASTGLMAWIVIYHYLALRRYFSEGRVKTLFKYTGLLILYFLLLMPTAFMAVLAVTVIQV